MIPWFFQINKKNPGLFDLEVGLLEKMLLLYL